MKVIRGILSVLLVSGSAFAQTAPAAAPSAAQTNKPSGAQPARPLQLQSLDPGARPDPFPPINPKYFTADSPTVATVDSYLHAMLGYDANRIWRVAAIQKTAVPGVSKVTAFISDKSAGAKVQSAAFVVLADGKHIVADSSVQAFGANPFAESRLLLQQRATGPSYGAVSKDLLFVEFADLQCPHCKDAQPIMARLAKDFPTARIVYESYPLTEIHPMAARAAAYGACIAQSDSDKFFTYAQAVYDTQGALTADDGEQTLKNAVAKTGLNPETIATCAAGPEAKAAVEASSKLAMDLGIEQTPMLAVNGRLLPITSVPYETLKTLILFQASLDGVNLPNSTPSLTLRK